MENKDEIDFEMVKKESLDEIESCILDIFNEIKEISDSVDDIKRCESIGLDKQDMTLLKSVKISLNMAKLDLEKAIKTTSQMVDSEELDCEK